ncbi:MAG: ATP-binding protein [Ignavibacteriae bacterium]|nr:ATP-binding protein [Ignavibacteriota bacterium]
MDNKANSEAYVNGNGKVHFGNKVDYAKKRINYEFNKFYFKEIFKLLVNVYEDKIAIPDFNVKRMFSHSADGYMNPITFVEYNTTLEACVDNTTCEFECMGVHYLLNMYIEVDRSRLTHYYLNFSYPKNQEPEERIGHELLRLAFHYTSVFRKGCCEIGLHNNEREVVSNLSVNFIKPPESNINNVFIKDDIKADIERFIYTFNNFEKHNTPLRYLLSGKPGLGKTEIIRSIISSCSPNGCVVIPKDMSGADWLVFEFAKLFSPVLVCIDDIDLIFGKRDEGYGKRNLNKFLTMLDGIMQNKFFLIATTNDKKLVDMAASRPGRFDEIIDFGDFERKYYMDLILNHTKEEKILNLFTDEVLNFMEGKKVSGAYIVNLIKQIKIMSEMNPNFSFDDLMKYLNRNYKGFYKSQIETDRGFGFGK